MGLERESRIDECVECRVREGDFSKKKVFRCEYCDRLLCEKHIEPKIAFIPNFNPTNYSPETEALYYQEYKRQGGHPDFRYSQKKFEDIETEEETRNELIKQALDKMNRYYPTKSTNPVKPISSTSEIDYPPKYQKPNSYKPKIFSNPRVSFHLNWKTKKLLKSLKFWLPAFLLTVGFLFLLEGNNPTSFYNSVPEGVKYVFYIFALGVSGWIGFRLFNRFDSNTSSDRGLFGLKILSGILLMGGVLMLVFGVFYQSGFFTDLFFQPTLSMARTTVSVFLVVLGFACLLVSGYLVFKFERRSGIIVYRR